MSPCGTTTYRFMKAIPPIARVWIFLPKTCSRYSVRSWHTVFRVQEPDDLFQLTALHDTYWEADWAAWLTCTGTPLPKRWRGLHFTLYAMALDAAVGGRGC